MAPRSFQDRFFTPKVARAIMSPLGIVLFGAGTAAAVLAGAGLFAPLVGVAAWGGNVLRSVPRDPRPPTVAAGKLAEPWRTYVAEARDAKRRFDDVVESMTAGPLRDRLAELAHRIQDGVAEAERIATRGNALSTAAGRIDTATPAAELAALKAQHAGKAMSPTTVETMRSLEAQLATAGRIAKAAESADARLRQLDAWLDELVARAVEVSLGNDDALDMSRQVDDVVHELEALRLALDETDRASGVAERVHPRNG